MAMDFSDMLASSIHDIKNSLSLISTTLSGMIDNPKNTFADTHQATLLQHQVQRVNHNLMQLLSLYKLGEGALSIDIDEQNVEDLFIECLANNQTICQALGVTLSYECDPMLNGFFDLEMIRSVIDSTIGNAQRYCKARIQLSAREEDGFLVIRVEDDGEGFPAAFLHHGTADEHLTLDQPRATGRTRLGLIFAEKICDLHRSGERKGHIDVKNNCGGLPGGCFELWLP
ncbi:sensor histidine kinase [Rhabdochromatium marinum]|uniref:sensor histidine kinase n=1 Tax=Rhabdochromatium marinum TaxID=48729 RepID=UPI0019087FDA|nr:HAMP domain-containing sensor histidine kinase [Rhabdochromatium marinum]MBK1648236.1 histidine kinase [Rhabdochromatium marinum]